MSLAFSLLYGRTLTSIHGYWKNHADVTLPTKVHIVKAMVFPVVMYGRESWAMKKAECRRTDAFELWCWRRLQNPLDCKEIKSVHPKGNQHSYSLEGLVLKLKLQYFSHLMWRADPLKKNLMLGNTEGKRRRGWQDEMVGWHHRLNGHEFAQTPGDSEGQGSLACSSPWGRRESDTTEWLNNDNQ